MTVTKQLFKVADYPLLTIGCRKIKKQKIGNRTQAGTQTETRIMDAASALFAQNGLKGVSIRDIVSDAKVNVALANYYFGSKEQLYVAAATRYVSEVNKKRVELLDLINTTPLSPKKKLKRILSAYVMPHFEVASMPGGFDYLKIFSRFNLDTPEISKSFMPENFGEIRQTYLSALRSVLRPISTEKLNRGFSLFVTGMLISPNDAGYVLLDDAEVTPDDLIKLGEILIEYSAAGLWALRD